MIERTSKTGISVPKRQANGVQEAIEQVRQHGQVLFPPIALMLFLVLGGFVVLSSRERRKALIAWLTRLLK